MAIIPRSFSLVYPCKPERAVRMIPSKHSCAYTQACLFLPMLCRTPKLLLRTTILNFTKDSVGPGSTSGTCGTCPVLPTTHLPELSRREDRVDAYHNKPACSGFDRSLNRSYPGDDIHLDELFIGAGVSSTMVSCGSLLQKLATRPATCMQLSLVVKRAAGKSSSAAFHCLQKPRRLLTVSLQEALEHLFVGGEIIFSCFLF